ncbi:hypothetical protein C3L33_17624, partial [Rhododendron williamsianum]
MSRRSVRSPWWYVSEIGTKPSGALGNMSPELVRSPRENENGWIERVKEEGAVPLLEPENVQMAGLLLPETFFGFVVRSPTKISEVLKNPKNRVRKALDDEFPTGNKPCVWAFNLQVPSKDNYSAIAYFVATEPIPDGSLMDQFLKGDDGFRKSRLKLIANIVKGPWLVRKAVGEQAICVIGRALTCQYYVADNFIEVDIDIGSSMVASAIVHLAFGYLTTLTVDLAFLIESQAESELPERILGAVRFSQLDVAAAREVELSSDGSAANSQSSLPTRFWNSIGQGFSNLVSGAHESNSVSTSSHVNGVVDPEHSGKEVQECSSALGDCPSFVNLVVLEIVPQLKMAENY